MNNNSPKMTADSNVKTQKNREENTRDTLELEMNDDTFYSGEDERISRKMAARRKIDIYMEKKRLKEELELNDFFDDELDF